MSYGRSKSDESIQVEQTAWLAEFLGLEVARVELEGLALALSNQVSAIQVLERFNLTECSPIVKMDARWYE